MLSKRSKFEKFKAIYQKEGLKASILYSINFLIAKTGWFKDKPLFGRIIEFRGNITRLDGCTFLLDSPLITTKIKSRFILGRYEREERDLIKRFLNPDFPVVELGASIGVVSCITNKRLKNSKAHIVIEANPKLIPILEKHRVMNGCDFKILNKALSYEEVDTPFYIHERFLSGSAYRKTENEIRIPVITLGEIINQEGYPSVNLICDIEGGEVDLVRNEKNILKEKVFQIIIEVHPSFVGEEEIEVMIDGLKSIGFKKIRTGKYSGIYNSVFVFENTNFL